MNLWMAMICPVCGSEVIRELKGWRVEDKCTNPDCPTNRRVRNKKSGKT
jgi:NAD-dependent DNA ligase